MTAAFWPTELAKPASPLNDDDDDDDKPVWPTWAVGVLFVLRDVETYNCGRRS
jgi:hypothetical protein